MVCQVGFDDKVDVRVHKVSLPQMTNQQPLSFTFSPADLRSLLCAYQSGFLVHHDNDPHAWKVRAIDYAHDNHGPGLLPAFTYAQVGQCVETLESRTVTRQGTQQPGWYWYVLQVWTFRADPLHPSNEARPAVREKDTARAVVAMAQLLARFL
jgi:hypothetical protein